MSFLKQRPISAAFFRGGTSRGLIFLDKSLLPYSARDRDRIIAAAMGSPDPDGRQIGGVGGGTSSTSKVAIVGKSASPMAAMAAKRGHALPGLTWIDTDIERTAEISDVVYRAGQVPINGDRIDWGSTCGNMIAAVALSSAMNNIQVLQQSLYKHFGSAKRAFADIAAMSLPDAESHLRDKVLLVRILAHDSGKVFRARIPLAPADFGEHNRPQNWQNNQFQWIPREVGTAVTAGVPGTEPSITIESTLEGSVLSTGNQRDVVEVDGRKIDVTVIDTGLPVVIVSAESADVSIGDLLVSPAEIESNKALMDKLERIRQAASALTPALQSKLSLAAPKICVVCPPTSYKTTGSVAIDAAEMDVFARTVSSGQLHRTIPATTLTSLAAAACFPSSIVAEIRSRRAEQGLAPASATRSALSTLTPPRVQSMLTGERVLRSQESSSQGQEDAIAITVGQPAGLATSVVQTRHDGVLGGKIPAALITQRSARQIWSGHVSVPGSIEPCAELRDILRPRQAKMQQPKSWSQSPLKF